MVPRLMTPSARSRLMPRDNDPDRTFQGHDPEAVAQALAAHSQKMSQLASSSFQGYDSSDMAKAIQSYIAGHQDYSWPQNLAQPSAETSRPSPGISTSMLAVTSASNIDGTTAVDHVFSLSALVHDQRWMSILLCIVWIITGLFLLFFGWSSFFWGCNLGAGRKRVDAKAKKASRLSPLFAGPPLAGGVGGIVVGFLFFSFLTTVITAAFCVSEVKLVSSTAYFIIWLLPGLLGAFLAGHWPLFARAFTGLLAGSCSTIVVTAMFGIQTMIIRAIIVAVCTSLITAPLLLPRHNVIHFHLLNICTSIIGMVTFLDGVALFAPPRASSDSWIDLWVLLFAVDGSSSEQSATRKWGTAAFKGLIAAAVLGALVGFLFELLFHRHAAEDPDMEWNNYLGSFTQRLEHQIATDMYDRAGAFEPAPSAWQKMSRALGQSRSPAAYDNISAINDLEKSPLTNLPSPRSRRRARRARATKARGGPAKFEALNKGRKDLHLADSDDESTDYDSDSSLRTLHPRGKALSTKAITDELADELKPLSTSGDSKLTGSTASKPRPPSYRTNSSKSSGSALSGTTLAPVHETAPLSSTSESGEKVPVRPTVSRQTTLSPPPHFPNSVSPLASPLTPAFPATPSLVNAITRIQAAQAQARAWYASRQGQSSSASSTAASASRSETASIKDALQPDSKELADESATLDEAAPIANDAASFQSWWKNEVKGDSTKS